MTNEIGMGGGWLFWVLIAVGAALLVVLLVRVLGGGVKGVDRGAQDARGASRARQQLDERYARGDLTSEEYRERIRAMSEGT
ncbi:MAG: SHOCT domain-containing protein [Rhodoglobus sp.]|nr:SHOCT domain-containing protein [Rhodoglobus sp.]